MITASVTTTPATANTIYHYDQHINGPLTGLTHTCTSMFSSNRRSSIDIPDTITAIGNYSFSRCSSVVSVAIPDSVRSIAWNAFSFCFNLSHVEIPSSVTIIGTDAFAYCSSLASIVIPDSVIVLGGFQRCTGLSSVNIPDSVTTIDHWAFASCYNLTSVVIPDSVTRIQDLAFYACNNLTTISIPENTSIGNSAFSIVGACLVPLYQAGYTLCDCVRVHERTCTPTSAPTPPIISAAPTSSHPTLPPTSEQPSPLTVSPTTPSPTTPFPSPPPTTGFPTSEPTYVNEVCMVEPGPTGLVALWDGLRAIPHLSFTGCRKMTHIVRDSLLLAVIIDIHFSSFQRRLESTGSLKMHFLIECGLPDWEGGDLRACFFARLLFGGDNEGRRSSSSPHDPWSQS
jgi:hypothetical protein